jgi:hypothetical protein
MGCSGLHEKPWGFKDEEVVRELLDGVSNEFDNTIRATPTRLSQHRIEYFPTMFQILL